MTITEALDKLAVIINNEAVDNDQDVEALVRIQEFFDVYWRPER